MPISFSLIVWWKFFLMHLKYGYSSQLHSSILVKNIIHFQYFFMYNDTESMNFSVTKSLFGAKWHKIQFMFTLSFYMRRNIRYMMSWAVMNFIPSSRVKVALLVSRILFAVFTILWKICSEGFGQHCSPYRLLYCQKSRMQVRRMGHIVEIVMDICILDYAITQPWQKKLNSFSMSLLPDT